MLGASVWRWLLVTAAATVCHLRVSRCSSTLLTYSIEEQLPVGTLVARLRRDATWLGRQYSADQLRRLRFEMVEL